MLKTADKRLCDFEGVWQIERRITHGDGQQAQLSGKARWTPKDGGLAYFESGLLHLPGQAAVRAERRYFWDEAMNVYFEDGSLFHRVPAAGGTVQHFCDPDTYEGIYDFGGWPRFEISWVVTGPRKSYHMHTIYEPWQL